METLFIVCASFGGVLFVARFAMQLVGGGDHHDVDTHGADSDTSFKALSLQGFTAFFLMFGLVGLACLKSQTAQVTAMAAASVAGLASVWVIAKIFGSMRRLESSGNLDLSKAIGQTGTVYLTIPASGTGQIQVSVQGALQTLSASSKHRADIPTGTLVKVTGILDGSILVVEKA